MKYRFHLPRLITQVGLISLLVTALVWPPLPAHASISACSVTLSPHIVTPGSSTALNFSLTNDDPDNIIQWIQILTPSGDFTVQSISAPDTSWSVNNSGDQAILTGDGLSPGDTLSFTAQTQAANTEAGAASWSIYVTDALSGNGGLRCDGDTSTQITSGDPFVLSGVTATNITSSTATITWTTNTPANSEVDLGQTTSYGNTINDGSGNFVTSHSVTLTGLSPSTGYHYRVRSSADAGGSGQSGDNTFVTAVAPPVAISSPSGPGIPLVTIAPTHAPTETIPPTVQLTTDVSRPFSQPPLITGLAGDNDVVSALEYSTDNGINWQPVTDVSRLNKRDPRHLKFNFTPVFTDDGNYIIRVRATDASGNASITSPATLVIDRLPPQTGPLIIAYGSQALQPDAAGIIDLVAGSDYRFTTSAIGGPTNLALDAQPVAKTNQPAVSFTLTPTPGTSRWSGMLSFATGGTYQLMARGVDGADNRTSRIVATIRVAAPGRLTEAGTGHVLNNANVIVHYREPASGAWRIWDGRPYHQVNPQVAAGDGTYSLVVPRGTYYLEIKAPLHYSFISNIFTTTRPQVIAAPIALGSIPHVTIGPLTLALPNLVVHTHDLPEPVRDSAASATAHLIGENLSDFTLPATDGSTQTALGLTGKPTLITILATWSPDGQAQIPQLAAAQANPDINITPIFSEEHLPLVTSYLTSAGYHLIALTDPDGILTKTLGVGPAPEHIFIDSTGKIKKIMIGVYTKDELLLQLGGL
jgi:hypothetical protein